VPGVPILAIYATAAAAAAAMAGEAYGRQQQLQ